MKNTKRSLFYYCLAAFIFSITFQPLFAQVQTPRYVSMGTNTKGYYEYLPQGYGSGTQTYPLIIFCHGIGELGDGSAAQLPKVLANGTPQLINSGNFPTSFTVNGQTSSFIILTPQFVTWPSGVDINNIITYATQHYRVNANKIYLTGLSMGGGTVWDFAGAGAAYANKVAAIVPVCGASTPDITRAKIISGTNLPVWALQNLGDPTVPVSNTQNWVAYINQAPAPAILAKATLWNVASHNAWSKAYDPSYRENGMNVYEWMLQYSRGSSSTAASSSTTLVNKAPVANAGSGQTITLPANSVTLNGSGTDADGSISAYNWKYISGPSQYSITSAYSAGTTITNLTQGTYVFRLMVTDNLGTTGTSDITIVVNAASSTSASSYTTVPAKIEGENYAGMSGIQTETTSDAGGGSDVDYIDPNDWMDYAVNVPTAASYTISFRVSSPAANAQFQLKKSDGTLLATVKVPNTGGYQTWQTVTATVALSAGQQKLRIVSTAPQWNNWNLNWINFASSTTIIATTSTVSSFKVEAENYSAMNGVQKETTSDAGGGSDIDYIDPNDWMDYSINAPVAGTYTVNFRVASPGSKAQLLVKKSDGTLLSTVNIPASGGYQVWETVTASVALVQGQQTIRIVSSAPVYNNWNFNWMYFTTGGSLSSIAANTTADATSITITPNPVQDKFILQINNSLTGNIDVQIIDAAGTMKKQFSLSKTTTDNTQAYLSIGDLVAGTYTIKVQMTGWSKTLSLIRQ